MASKLRYRSQYWFNDPSNIEATALYCAWHMNDGSTREELQSGKPIIGISQSGSDLTPCNKIHRQTVEAAKRGVKDAGGIPFVFPVHPIRESTRWPAASLDRNLAAMALIEILQEYPIDGVVFTTGCDGTTLASLMAAVVVNLPAIVLSGGPMLNGHFEGQRAGFGTTIREARRRLEAGQWTESQFFDAIVASAPSLGHCNTMGAALTMNSVSEALGMSLTGSAAIPAAYQERLQNAFETGKRAVELTEQNIRPLDILGREAFENAIVTLSAIGGSSSAHQHLTAVARHAGIDLPDALWMEKGYTVPLIANLQPVGEFLGEDFHRAGGVPAVMAELCKAGLLNGNSMTVGGRPLAACLKGHAIKDERVIRPFGRPLRAAPWQHVNGEDEAGA